MMNKRNLLIISILLLFVVGMSLSAVSAKSTSKQKTIKVTTFNYDYHLSFKVTAKQYKKIKKAVKTAKKRKFLYKGFQFKRKTNYVYGKSKVYAVVTYEGWTKYKGGEHFYYPYVDFYAKKGRKSKWIDEALIGCNPP